MRAISTSLFLLLLFSYAPASDSIPGAPQSKPIALVGGTIYPIASSPIKNGTILFEAGRITEIGPAKKVKIPKSAKQIDVSGKQIYPGLFDANTRLGLYEIGAVRSTQDSNEIGSINPNVRAFVAVNPDSELIPVTRANGVLLAVTQPSGGTVSGQAAVIQLDGWTYEQMTIHPTAGMIVSWPGVPDGITGSRSSQSVDRLRKLFDDARAYQTARAADSTQPTDLKLEALGPVLDRKMPLIVSAFGASTIQSAISFALEQDVRLILYGADDALLCRELIIKHDIPVITSVYKLPRRSDDPFDAPYTLPARLHAAGIKFCISAAASSRTTNVRNLPYHAGTAVAYGLDYDTALRAITLSPAEILGVDDQVGSLETGKDATLIVTDGDPLETSSHVTHAWIQGRPVDLSSRHTQLNDKYREKYRQLGHAKSRKSDR